MARSKRQARLRAAAQARAASNVVSYDDRAIRLWDHVGTFGPPLAFILSLAIVWLSGGLDNFGWNQPVTFLQSVAMLGAMCFPIAVFLFASARWTLALARASSAWPTTAGVVRESSVGTRRGSLRTVYWHALRYTYEVDGRSYDGDQAQFGPPNVTNKALVETVASRYAPGARVTVHYEPDDPATSTLETSDEMARQPDWRIWYFAAAPFVLSVVLQWNAGP
jgi:hypothetical protein